MVAVDGEHATGVGQKALRGPSRRSHALQHHQRPLGLLLVELGGVDSLEKPSDPRPCNASELIKGTPIRETSLLWGSERTNKI